jgi:hypothetical protein
VSSSVKDTAAEAIHNGKKERPPVHQSVIDWDAIHGGILFV